MFQIKKKMEAKAQKYLTEANRLLTEGLKNEKIQEFELTCMILSSTIKDGEEQATTLRSQIKNVLWKSKPNDIATFLKELNILYEKEQKQSTFYFVATSNLDIKSVTQQEFELNGVKIRLISAGDAEKEFQITSLFNEWQVFAELEQRKFLHYSYVFMDVLASNPRDAHQVGLETFELFRGIINFANDYQTISKTFYGGIPEPRTLSVMEPARVQMIFDEKKTHLFDWFTIGFFDYSSKSFATKRMNFLLDLLKTINSLEKTPLRDRCITAFTKYNNGMDGNVAGTSFLEFWKILELVAIADLEEQGMAEYKVAHRIAWLFKEAYVRDLIMYLCDRRNFITHKGHLPDIDDDELITIKRFAEEAIMFLLRHVNLFKDNATLSCYFDMLSKNETELDRLELAIREANKYLGFKQEEKPKTEQKTTTQQPT